MKLLKPGWVTHDERPIFSVDIHPDGSRFATGGQGDDSGRVVVWNMAPVASEKVEKDENVPKLLCQMDNHLACVNSVRWSHSGKHLASGGDDKLVMIWQIGKFQGGNSGLFGGSGQANVEQWRCVATLRGHVGDVLDLAWSPHNLWLASCSVDNTVIIWNALKFSEIIATLKGHTGLVKGVAWDPVGKYIASQSDDKSLMVWRTSDWQRETAITEPFDECGNTTHVLRLSWSPDGQYLVTAHAMNGGGPTAQIVERDGWKTDKDFVGHRKAITCVRFNSNILQKFNKNLNKPQQYCCCAIGSRDRSLSIWLTALKRPLVVVHELFSNSILDMSWSVSGFQLMVCSWDGTVAYVEFSKDELGTPLTAEEKNSLHQRMYGKAISICNSENHMATAIVENPELLSLREQQEKRSEEEAAAKQVGSTNSKATLSVASSAPKGPINKQIETRTVDGKRRITPMYIPPAPDIGEIPQPFGTSTLTFSSSSEARSKIPIEKRNDTDVPSTPLSPLPKSAPASSPVTPMDTVPKLPCTVNGQIESAGSTKQKEKSSDTHPPAETPKTSEKLPTLTLKRKAERDGTKPAKRGRPPIVDKIAHPVPKSSPPQTESGRQVRPSSLQTREIVNLPALRIEKKFTIQISSNGKQQNILEAENSFYVGLGSLSFHRLRLLEGSHQLWQIMFSSPLTCVKTSSKLYVVGCEDGCLHVFSTTGKALYPPLALGAPLTKLAVEGWVVIAVSTRGAVNMWDFHCNKSLLRDESLLPLLFSPGMPNASLVSCSLTVQGRPLLTISTGKAYTYSFDLESWVLLLNAKDPVQQMSSHHLTVASMKDVEVSTLPLASVQLQVHSSTNAVTGFQSSVSSNQELQKSCTLTHLESQVATAKELSSPFEYKFWFLTLVRFLTQEGVEKRLRLICNELLGPVHSSAKESTSWEITVLGHSKHQLLEEVLNILGSNLNLQRLYTEFQEQLEFLKGKSDVNGSDGYAVRCLQNGIR